MTYNDAINFSVDVSSAGTPSVGWVLSATSAKSAAWSALPTMTATVGGMVPTPPNNTTTFLRGDGTFATPPAVWG